METDLTAELMQRILVDDSLNISIYPSTGGDFSRLTVGSYLVSD